MSEENVIAAAGERRNLKFLEFERTLVQGLVHNKNGIPIVGAGLSGARSGYVEITVMTDEKSYFKLENASPGHQFIRVNAQAYMTETNDFDAKKCEETNLEFHLTQAVLEGQWYIIG